jgi:uncharacterized SAM-binding protein YcdF (DUF218 family)
MSPHSRTTRRAWIVRGVLVVVTALVVAAGAWASWIYGQIEYYAGDDQAAPADAICVFGAAEYDGRPSPVYKARLDHALSLYNRNIAPLIITLGGDGGDQYSEGGVGKQYLMSMGVPEADIIAETHSRSTEEAAHRLAVIARANGLHRLVVASDGTHLFRIHAMCAADGLDVLTSPRPIVQVEGSTDQTQRIAHEMLSYMAWRLHLH